MERTSHTSIVDPTNTNDVSPFLRASHPESGNSLEFRVQVDLGVPTIRDHLAKDYENSSHMGTRIGGKIR